MAENDKGGTEYFLENDIECDNINGSSNNIINNVDLLVDDDEINEVARKSASSSTSSMFSQQWPRSFRYQICHHLYALGTMKCFTTIAMNECHAPCKNQIMCLL